MLLAINKAKEACNLTRLERHEIKLLKKMTWFCPGCHKEVMIKCGNVISPHFAHKNKESCHLFSENESEEHLKGKQIIAANCEKYGVSYQLEAYLPKLNQRPDVLINENIAIEFQCSSLSIERFRERSDNYLKNGYQVIWVLGKNLQMKNKLSPLLKHFISYSHTHSFYLWEMDVSREVMSLVYFIQATFSKVSFKKKLFNLQKTSLLEVLALSNHVLDQEKMKILATKNYHNQLNKWNQELNAKQPRVMRIQSFLYEQGYNLRDINREYFYPSFLNPLLLEEEIYLRFFCYHFFVDYQKGTINELLLFLETKMTISSYSLVNKEQLLRYSLSLYLCYLKERGMIEVNQLGVFSFTNKEIPREIEWEILWLPLKYGMISK